MLLKNNKGFSLTEMIIVMAIFIVVIIITANAFERIIYSSVQQSKSAETQIEGLVGLELLRADLEQAGFGLPWEFTNTVTYAEAAFTNISTGTTYFNDAPSSAPRAVLSGNTSFNKDSDGKSSQYLVIKSIIAAANDTSQKWTTVSFDNTNTKTIRGWGDPDRDLAANERVIVLKDALAANPPSRQLLVTSGNVFSTMFNNYSSLMVGHTNGDTYQVYGVNPDTDLLMPFNRADYYVKRPSTNMPASCAPNTGILYKSVVSHVNGAPSVGMPLLDCVADLQVVYGFDTDAAGFINDYSDTITLHNAKQIREKLREIRIYLLAHEGTKDRLYSYPSETILVGEQSIASGREFNLKNLIGSDYKYYRWKVYTIVVRPKNIIQ